MLKSRTPSAQRILPAVIALVLSACATGAGIGTDRDPAGVGPLEEPTPTPRSITEDAVSPGEDTSPSDAPDAVVEPLTTPGDGWLEGLARALANDSVNSGLVVWGQQTMFGLTEAEHYERVEDMSRRASAVIVGRILGPGPDREVHGDPGTDDVVKYASLEVEVVGFLAGTRDIAEAERLIIETFRAPAEEGAGSVAVMFLRHKQDTTTGERDPNARADEAGLYRLVSHQGVFIDRGDGVPINPMSEVRRLVESGEDIPLDEFIFSDNLPRPEAQPIAAQARALTMDQFLQLITNAGK